MGAAAAAAAFTATTTTANINAPMLLLLVCILNLANFKHCGFGRLHHALAVLAPQVELVVAAAAIAIGLDYSSRAGCAHLDNIYLCHYK